MKSEEWREVPGWSGLYEVSNFGGVRSIKRYRWTTFGLRPCGGKVLKVFQASTGYSAVNFTSPAGARVQMLVHSLVLSAFVGPRPEGMEACHNDGNRLNPALDNLRWDTRKNNHKDKHKHGTAQVGERSNGSKLRNFEAALIKSGAIAIEEAVKRFGISKGTAMDIFRGRTWRHLNAS